MFFHLDLKFAKARVPSLWLALDVHLHVCWIHHLNSGNGRQDVIIRSHAILLVDHGSGSKSELRLLLLLEVDLSFDCSIKLVILVLDHLVHGLVEEVLGLIGSSLLLVVVAQ